MKTLYLVSCGSSKTNHETQASRLYTGNLFVKMSRYVLRQPNSTWRILSAKHGLLHPGEIVRPYNQRMPQRRLSQLAWSLPVVDAISRQFTPAIHQIVLLAGADYCTQLSALLEQRGWKVSQPMKGMGVGKRLAWLKRNTPGAKPAELLEAEQHQAHELAGVSPMHTGGRVNPCETLEQRWSACRAPVHSHPFFMGSQISWLEQWHECDSIPEGMQRQLLGNYDQPCTQAGESCTGQVFPHAPFAREFCEVAQW